IVRGCYPAPRSALVMEPAAVSEEVAVLVVHVIHMVAVLDGLVPAAGTVLVILVSEVLFVLVEGVGFPFRFDDFPRFERVRVLPERRRHLAHDRPPPMPRSSSNAQRP